jgi:T4 RnlA family RNA ligase
MKVQKFIKDNGVDALSDQFGIEVKKYPNGYVKLNYSQIDSPKHHPIADECRGLVLYVNDENSSYVVTRPFSRFYNFGEGNTRDFDFSDCFVWEKADGSMTTVSWSPLDQKWIIGTRGMAYAEGNFVFSLTASGGTFKDWILKAMGLTDEQFQENMKLFPTELTYVFEYTAPENKIVTYYPEAKMVILAVIDNDTGEEENPYTWFHEFAKFMNIRMPQTYPAASGDDLVKLADSLPNLQEGFVVHNRANGQRVKIKSKVYAAVHHLRGNGIPSMNRLMEVVLMNEQDELLTYFPEFQQYVDPVVDALRSCINNAVAVYANAKHHVDQKSFALDVKDTMVAPICFKARKDGVDALTAFESMDLSQQVKILERYL